VGQGRSITSPEDQKVTFVELFFDLIFVFCVTQIVSLLHAGITPVAVGRAVLLFWLVWWAWTQFTWTLNAADTTHPFVELATMFATGTAFFMAVSIPMAFGSGGLAFAATYVLGRVIGLVLYRLVAAGDLSQRAAVLRFTMVSLTGLAAVIAGGAAEGALRYWLWGAAIVLDVVAAVFGAESEGWNLHPEHFGERHGLFVIIALGETLIVAAAGVTRGHWGIDLVMVAILAVATTCGMWWIYFSRAKPSLDHELEKRRGRAQSSLARDVYSLFHFPVLCGVIAYATVLEAAIHHPHDPLSLASRIALAAGLLLFIATMTLAMFRARIRGYVPRVAIAVVTAAILIALGGVPPAISLVVALAGVVVVAVVESRSYLTFQPSIGDHHRPSVPPDAVV
jgi:low temperature requirement protein LtrA